MRPREYDGRDWDAELKDDENPRGDVQRLRRLMDARKRKTEREDDAPGHPQDQR